MARIRLGLAFFLLIFHGHSFATNIRQPAAACPPLGDQRGLVIAVNFPESPGDINNPSPAISVLQDRYFGASNSLKDFWEEVSYGKTRLTGDIAGWYTLNMTGSSTCGTGSVRSRALQRAATEFDLTQYNRIFVHINAPAFCTRRSMAAGCASISTPQGIIQATSSYNYTSSETIVYHEAGHNLGLPHASNEDFGAASVGDVGVAGSHGEYGDMFDVMGGFVNFVPVHHNSIYKYGLGYLDDNDLINVNTTGTYVIEPLGTPKTAKKVIRVFRGAFLKPSSSLLEIKNEHFWIETRKNEGYDSNIDSRGPDNNGLPVGSIAATAFGGAIVRIHRDTKPNSLLVDTHPGTDTAQRDFLDAPIVVGETFTDPVTGISFTHDAVDPITGNITVTVAIPDPDTDEDGLPESRETVIGTDTANVDSDGDGLTDFQEVCFDSDCSQYNPGTLDTNPTLPDTDGDAMPDGWEFFNGLNPLVDDSAGDADSDGLPNLGEYQNGTDPNLLDSDADGLSDGDEVNLIGTDPLNLDTDGDSMRDGWEVDNALDPLINDAADDPDGDGLPNSGEFIARSDPHVPDTDGDTLLDGEEVNTYGTNPIKADTDGDKIPDNEEINLYGTDPLSGADTDGDTMPDDWESARGTDLTLYDGTGDVDGDGVENVVEFLRDTLPADPVSFPITATLYVDAANISGVEDGSQANPFNTLAEAYGASQDGDTVQLAAGNYSDVFGIQPGNVRVLGPTGPGQTAAYSMTLGAWSGTAWGGFSDVDISVNFNLTIGNFQNFSFRHCRINRGQWIKLESSRITFENVIFTGGGTALIVDSASHVDLNHITTAGSNGPSVAAGASLTLYNSILASNLTLAAGVDTNNIRFNLISNGSLNGINGNITGTPMFADPVAGDYHLQPGSIAIDAGDPAANYDNEPENNGDRVNMGRYGNTTEATAGLDSDGDGLTDQNEWCYDGDCSTNDPYDPVVNPSGGDLNGNSVDTDSDGFSDIEEITWLSDPLDIISLPQGTGDANGDLIVDFKDALLIQRAVLNIVTPTAQERVRGDVNLDGVLTLTDFMRVQRMALKY